MNDAELLADICRSFPSFVIESWRPLGEGWMSRALLVNEAYVFRFAKHAEASADLRKEVALLPAIADHVALAVPRFELVAEQSSGLGFVGYRAIAGEPLESALLSGLAPAVGDLVVSQLATFIDQLQRIPRGIAEQAGLVPTDHRAEYEQDREKMRALGARLPADAAMYLERRFGEFLGNGSYFSNEARLIHADLSPEHLLFDSAQQRLVGVIDFGDLSLADPDYEYVYLLEDLGADVTTRVMSARGERQQAERLEKVGYFVTFDHLQSIFGGLEHGQPDWIAEGVAALRDEAASHIR